MAQSIQHFRKHRLPSREALVDLSWLLDSALVCRDRARPIESADRLAESLLHYQVASAGDDCVALLADVASVRDRLAYGASPEPVEFRHRVEALAVIPDNYQIA
jgi:hypothetical protein